VRAAECSLQCITPWVRKLTRARLSHGLMS
jgi:hypothetical protein